MLLAGFVLGTWSEWRLLEGLRDLCCLLSWTSGGCFRSLEPIVRCLMGSGDTGKLSPWNLTHDNHSYFSMILKDSLYGNWLAIGKSKRNHQFICVFSFQKWGN